MHFFIYLVLCALLPYYAYAQTPAADVNLPTESLSFQWQTQNDPPPEPFSYDEVVLKANGNVSVQVILRGWQGCDATDPCTGKKDQSKRNLIKAGFEEMQKMIPDNFQDPVDPSDPPVNRYDIDWNSAAAIEFWGSHQKTQSYRELVQLNMNSLAAQVSESWFGWTLNVRCDDVAQECVGKTEAYTIHGGGMDNHINFCDPYFKLSSLDIAVDTAGANGDPVKRDVLSKYWNRATVWAHELMHVSGIGRVNPIVGTQWMTDITYGRRGGSVKWKQYRVQDAKWLAAGKESPAHAAAHNPQNYALYALANYIVRRRTFYPSAAVWLSTMEPPKHDLENPTVHGGVSDTTVGEDLLLRC